MDTSFVAALEKRAETMLPPGTVMCIECAGDVSGDRRLAALLEEIEEKGLRGEPLCAEPYETVVFSDRVLLRCGGCGRMDGLPRFAGIGRGQTEAQARRNALYALTLPPGKPDLRRGKPLCAMRFGQGPVEAVAYACAFNRAAYLHGVPENNG